MVRILECSSQGDFRFSAFHAEVTIFGRTTNIERHYQSAKRTYVKRKKMKGVEPDYIELGGYKFASRFNSQWYSLLWLIYLDRNPYLVEFASEYDKFTDAFRGNSLNCQADVVEKYVKQGRNVLYEDCKELINILTEKCGFII